MMSFLRFSLLLQHCFLHQLIWAQIQEALNKPLCYFSHNRKQMHFSQFVEEVI